MKLEGQECDPHKKLLSIASTVLWAVDIDIEQHDVETKRLQHTFVLNTNWHMISKGMDNSSDLLEHISILAGYQPLVAIILVFML